MNYVGDEINPDKHLMNQYLDAYRAANPTEKELPKIRFCNNLFTITNGAYRCQATRQKLRVMRDSLLERSCYQDKNLVTA